MWNTIYNLYKKIIFKAIVQTGHMTLLFGIIIQKLVSEMNFLYQIDNL